MNAAGRISWDNIWIEFAYSISRRSVDPAYKVGAVIVTNDNSQVLALGYNGDHAGGSNERDSDVPGMSGFIHAEINALIKLDFNNPKQKSMYVTMSPCRMCAKCIINAGIASVVYVEKYRDSSGIDLLLKAGTNVIQHSSH